MCQDSFDEVFDVLEELASCGELESVSVTTTSGQFYTVEPANFVEDNFPVRSHSTQCLLLKQDSRLIHIDLAQIESLAQE